MMSRLLIFLTVASLVWAGLHFYVARRLAKSLSSPRARRSVFWCAAGLWAVAPATFVLGRVRPELVTGVSWIAFLYMGLFAMVFFFLVLQDAGLFLLQLGGRLARRPFHDDRRAFLVQGGNTVALGLSGVLASWGVYESRRLAQVVEVEVPIDGLPDSLRGYRIAQISDLHVGPSLKGDWLARIVERVNALDADLVAVTGDLIDGTVATLRAEIAPLAGLRGRDGVFFVTGNHEYYWDGPAWCEHVTDLGLQALVNEHRVIERSGARVVVAGCTDYAAGKNTPGHASDPEAALFGAPLADVKVLLAHQPKSIDAAVRAGADLQLSGHTHGGQFFPFNLLVGFAHPFSRGLGKRDRTWIYVNPGTGYWGPPLRHGVPAEITLLRLVPGAPSRG